MHLLFLKKGFGFKCQNAIEGNHVIKLITTAQIYVMLVGTRFYNILPAYIKQVLILDNWNRGLFNYKFGTIHLIPRTIILF